MCFRLYRKIKLNFVHKFLDVIHELYLNVYKIVAYFFKVGTYLQFEILYTM